MDAVQLLLFNTLSLGIPGAHFINFKQKYGKYGWVDLGATQLFSTQDAWIENLAP